MIKFKDTRIILCKWLPNDAEAITLRWVILFRRYNYEMKSKAYIDAVLEHEYTHVLQQRKLTLLIFGFLYFFSSKNRLQFELEAYRYNYNYYRSINYNHIGACELIATMLSSRTYFNMLSYAEANSICLSYYDNNVDKN